DGTVRGYTDTNEGVYFQYPYTWGESYSFTNDDGSLTNALNDEAGTQAIYADVYLETDALSALEFALEGIDGEISEITETTFGGLPAYQAAYLITGDEGSTTALVISLANEPAASVVVLTFAGNGDGVEPDSDVINWVDATLTFFPPLLD
ncbi:MAG TPA: hypothetical protein VER79_03685, partial [Candidatus Limnocylindrales bacterium]|nr:hypothetical protein [Candidatus Limnocylindrales bacterium]